MQEHMSAVEYQNKILNGFKEPENPYLKESMPSNRDVIAFGRREAKKHYLSTPTEHEIQGLIEAKKHYLSTPTEHEIQGLILERLGLLQGAFFWRENSGLVNLGNDAKKRMFRAGIKGIADIMGVYKGFSVAIEVKRPGKKQSVDQRAFQQRFDQCGGVYVVCSDVTQVVNQIMAAISIKRGD